MNTLTDDDAHEAWYNFTIQDFLAACREQGFDYVLKDLFNHCTHGEAGRILDVMQEIVEEG
jgi:non-ribosomal peptide synthetase component F